MQNAILTQQQAVDILHSEQPPEPEPNIISIGLNVAVIDGRVSPYDQLEPGDVIELESGVRVPLQIRNISGTQEKPIIIRNARDGIVEINTAYGWYGFWLRNCHYFRFTGGNEYGIKITRSQYNGIIFQNKTDNFEIDHIEMNRVDNGIGIQGQTVSTTTADYDYNNDGKIDNTDIVTRETYLQENWHIHDLKLNFDTNLSTVMGVYVGNSNYLEESNPLVHNCHIHDIYIRNTSQKALQVGSVVEGFDVHDIDIAECVLGADNNNVMAISINPGCNGELHSCKIVDCKGRGIGWLGTGGKIYNNLVVRCGRANTYFADAIYVAYKDSYTHAEPTQIYNNTIIDPVNYGIIVGSQLTGTKQIKNNIIVSSLKRYKQLPAGSEYVNNIEIPAINNPDDFNFEFGYKEF